MKDLTQKTLLRVFTFPPYAVKLSLAYFHITTAAYKLVRKYFLYQRISIFAISLPNARQKLVKTYAAAQDENFLHQLSIILIEYWSAGCWS